MYNAIEREDPGFIAETDAMIRDAKAFIRTDPLPIECVLELEYLLDELDRRGVDTATLYPKREPEAL